MLDVIAVVGRGLLDVQVGTPGMVVASSSAVHAAIPPVLDGVVAASAKAAGDLGPALAHFANHLLDENALLGSDGVMVEVGFQILVETFATLLGRAGLNGRRDADPVVGAMDADEMK